jgi:hypothetical protein
MWCASAVVGDLGAYGLRVEGVPGAARWMQPQRADAPALEIAAEVAPPDDAPSHVDQQLADIRLVEGGRLRARRGEGRVTFSVTRRPSDAELLHPYLAPAAALVWQWAGEEALHAGAVIVEGRAVLVFGEKEAGKSTTLAWLAEQAGLGVLADDLVVVKDERALAGPRSIDLRLDAPVAGGLEVRAGERRRLTLAPIEPAAPVAGVVVLAWGDAVAAERIAPSERLGAIADQRTYGHLEGKPRVLLDLAALPMWLVRRPRTLAALPHVGETLVRAFG